jgi:hypothetical protein
MKPFKKRFMEDTFPVIAEQNLWTIANGRAARNGTDPQEEFERAEKEFKSAGAYPFTFDSGTPPAVKQLRHKLLMSACGSINLQIDEIGSNLIGSTDVLTLFLELYDQGIVKQKLIKNTADNQRGEELDGKTPICCCSAHLPSCWMVARLRSSSTRSSTPAMHAVAYSVGGSRIAKRSIPWTLPKSIGGSWNQPTTKYQISGLPNSTVSLIQRCTVGK